MITARTSTIERKWDEGNNKYYFYVLVEFYVDDVTPLNIDETLKFPDKETKTEILAKISNIVKAKNDDLTAVSTLGIIEGTVVTQA